MRNDKRFTVVAGLSADIVGFVFDQRDRPSPKITGNDGQPLAANPFHDKRVRTAVDLAIDRDAIRDRVMNGQSAPDNQLMRPGQYGYDPASAAAALRSRPKRNVCWPKRAIPTDSA